MIFCLYDFEITSPAPQIYSYCLTRDGKVPFQTKLFMIVHNLYFPKTDFF